MSNTEFYLIVKVIFKFTLFQIIYITLYILVLIYAINIFYKLI
nr:MAG TPA: hypothetical protein [Caudoviricetes sp.]